MEPQPLLDVCHRAAACFHGMLSMLQSPLRRLIAERVAAGPQLALEAEQWRQPAGQYGVGTPLQFVRDHWETHFCSHVAHSVLRDVITTISVQNQLYQLSGLDYGATARGIDAVRGLLVEIDSEGIACDGAQTLRKMLRMDVEDVEGAEDMPPVDVQRKTLVTKAERLGTVRVKGGDERTRKARAEAIGLLTEALALATTAPQRREILLTRTEYELEEGDVDAAVVDAAQVLAGATGEKGTAVRLASVLIGLKKWGEALEVYDLALKHSLDDFELLDGKAVVLRNIAAREEREGQPPTHGPDSQTGGCVGVDDVAVGTMATSVTFADVSGVATVEKMVIDVYSPAPRTSACQHERIAHTDDVVSTALCDAQEADPSESDGSVTTRSGADDPEAIGDSECLLPDTASSHQLKGDVDTECEGGDNSLSLLSPEPSMSPSAQVVGHMSSEDGVSEVDSAFLLGATEDLIEPVTTGFFHALLSVLQKSLSIHLLKRREDGPLSTPHIEMQTRNFAKACIKKQLQFIKDHWETHFTDVTDPSLLADLKKIVNLQIRAYYAAHIPRASFDQGIAIVERVLVLIDADEETASRVQLIKKAMLRVSASSIASNEEQRDPSALISRTARGGAVDLVRSYGSGSESGWTAVSEDSSEDDEYRDGSPGDAVFDCHDENTNDADVVSSSLKKCAEGVTIATPPTSGIQYDEVSHGQETTSRTPGNDQFEELITESPAGSRGTVNTGDQLTIGCFFALLNILQRPLIEYVSRIRAEGPLLTPEVDKEYKNLAKGGTRVQLQFITDHWATHFSAAAPWQLLNDLKTLVGTQNQAFYTASVSSVACERGISAVERVLVIVSADQEILHRAQHIKKALLPHSTPTVLDKRDFTDPPTQAGEVAPEPASGIVLSTVQQKMSTKQQRKQLIKNAQLLATRGEIAKAIDVLSEALLHASSKKQKAKIRLLRSEWFLATGEQARAYEDAMAVSQTSKLKSSHAKGVERMLHALRPWSEANGSGDDSNELLPLSARRIVEPTFEPGATALRLIDIATSTCVLPEVVQGKSNKRLQKQLVKDAELFVAQCEPRKAIDALSKALFHATSKKLQATTLLMRSECYLASGQHAHAYEDAAIVSRMPELKSSLQNRVRSLFLLLHRTEATTARSLSYEELCLPSPAVVTTLPVSSTDASEVSLEKESDPHAQLVRRANTLMASSASNVGGCVRAIDAIAALEANELQQDEAKRLANVLIDLRRWRDAAAACALGLVQNSDSVELQSLQQQAKNHQLPCTQHKPEPVVASLPHTGVDVVSPVDQEVAASQSWMSNDSFPVQEAVDADAMNSHRGSEHDTDDASSSKEPESALDCVECRQLDSAPPEDAGVGCEDEKLSTDCVEEVGSTSPLPSPPSRVDVADSALHASTEGRIYPMLHGIDEEAAKLPQYDQSHDGKPETKQTRGNTSDEMRKAMKCIAGRDFGNAVYWVDKELLQTKPHMLAYSLLRLLRARCRFELGQFVTVCEVAEEVLRCDATIEEAFYWKSAALLRLDRVSEARAACDEGLVIHPGSERLLRHREQHLTLLSDTAAGVETTQECYKQADECYKAQDYHQAIAWCSKALELLSTDEKANWKVASILTLRGDVFLRLCDHQNALRDAEEALLLRQWKYVKASILKIEALTGMHRFGEALQACVVAMAASGDLPEIGALRTQLVDQLVSINTRPGTSEKRKQLVQRALAYVADGKLEAAVATFTEALGEVGSLKQAATMYMHRARCYMLLERYDLSAQDASVAITVPDTFLTGSKTLAKALVELGNLDAASHVCNTTAEAAPSDLTIQAIRDYITQRRTGERNASEASPPDVSSSVKPPSEWEAEWKALMQSGFAFTAKSKHHNAEQMFIEALVYLDKLDASLIDAAATATKKVTVLGHLARCQLELHDYELTLKHAREGLVLDVEWVEGYRLVCRALMALDRRQEALAACMEVRRRVPQDTAFQDFEKSISAQIQYSKSTAAMLPVTQANTSLQASTPLMQVKALLQRGIELHEKGNVAEAENILSSALSLLDNNKDRIVGGFVAMRVRILGHRTRCRIAMEKFEAAVKDARVGIASQPDWVDGFRLLSKALVGLEKWQDAVAACNHVLKRVPHDVACANLKETLQAKCGFEGSSASSVTGSTPDESCEKTFMTLAQNAMKQVILRQYVDAEKTCSDAIALLESLENMGKISPFTIAGVYINRARCRVAAEDFASALRDARAGARHNPKWVECFRIECVALMRLQRWAEAKLACENVLKQHANDVAFKSHESVIHEKIQAIHAQTKPEVVASAAETPGEFVDGAAAPQVDAAATKKQLNLLVVEGVSLVASKDFPKAESKFSQAIRLLDGRPRAKKWTLYFGHRARCRLEMESFQSAMEDATEGLRCDSSWTEGVRLQCRASIGLGRWEVALQFCERVLLAAPNDVIFQKLKQTISEKIQPDTSIRGGFSEPIESKQDATESEMARHSDRAAQANTNVQSSPMPAPDLTVTVEHTETPPSLVCRLAADGSIVAQLYLAAQRKLEEARHQLHDGDLERTFQQTRDALVLWPRLAIPNDIATDLLLVGSHDAIAWGGPMLCARLQSGQSAFGNYASEREFWRQRVERFPTDAQLRIAFADVLFRGNELDASREQVDKAIELVALAQVDSGETGPGLIVWTMSWLYLRARCVQNESSTHWLQSLFSLRSQQQLRRRADELLAYVEQNSMDDEWMPHACYSIGVASLAENDLVRAKQFHYLAGVAESRRAALALLPAIDDAQFTDKRKLNEAFAGDASVLSAREQDAALTVPLSGDRLKCGWCEASPALVGQFVGHKLRDCRARPALATP